MQFIVRGRKRAVAFDFALTVVPVSDEDPELEGYEPQPPYDRHSTLSAHIEHDPSPPEPGNAGHFGFGVVRGT